MILNKVSMYQAIEIQSLPNKKTNMNTVSDDILPGVKIELVDHLVTISHPDWDEDVLVSTANVRYAIRKKEVVITFQPEINNIAKESSTLVSKSHRTDTSKTKKAGKKIV